MKRMLKRTLSLILAMIMVMGVLPLNAMAAMVMDNSGEGRAETPVIDRSDPIVDTHAGPISSGDVRPEPVPSEGPGDEGELLWDNVTLDAVLLDESTGEIRVTGKLPDGNTSSAGLENGAIVLAPTFGINTLRAMAGDGDISTDSSADWLSTNLPAGLGVDASLIYVADISTEKFSNGSWTYTAFLGSGMGYSEYIAKAMAAGVSISEDTGIPMQVMLISQGSKAGICFADVTIQPKQAILKIDGDAPDVSNGNGVDTIYLDSSAKSFVFDIKHTSASTETAEFQEIQWQGNQSGRVILPAIVGSTLTTTAGSTTIEVKLAASVDEGADPYIGDVVIAYNDGINGTYRYLRVHVVPAGEEPIRITVVAGGPAVAGGPEAPAGGRYVFVSEEEPDCGEPYTWEMGAVADGSATVVDANASDGIILGDGDDAEDGTPGTMIAGYGVKSLMEVIQYEEENYDWSKDEDDNVLLADGFSWPNSPGNIITARATAETKPGEYSAGYINVAYIDETIDMGYKQIPVIVIVEEPGSYDAVFYGNGGTWTEDGNTVTTKTDSTTDELKKGQKVDNIPGDPTRSGYTFQGWGDSSSATTALNATAIKYGNVAGTPAKYYAIWKKDATTYTLTYKANGGAFPAGVANSGNDYKVTEDDAAANHTFNLEFGAAKVPTRDNYVFAGWADASNATSPDYTAGGTSSVTLPEGNSDKVVYAVWTPVYTVTYANATSTYPQIGTLPTDTNKYQSNTPVTVKYASDTAVNAEKTASDGKVYKFTGWTRSDTSALITGASLTMPTTNLTLTATWQEVKYTVKFDTNKGTKDLTPSVASGSGILADQGSLSAGAPVTLPTSLTDTKGHYTFLGWAKTNSATSALSSYSVAAADANTNKEITLYAVWAELKYDVEYKNSATSGDPQFGATGTTLASTSLPATAQYMKDATVNVAAGPTGEHTNASGLYYTFDKWTTSDATVSSGTFTMPGKKVTLTANWTPVNVTVTYDYNGGTAGTPPATSTTVQKGGDYTITEADPSKTGATFAGWKVTSGTTTTGSSATLSKDQDVKGVTTNITLTAQWTTNQYTVTFKRNYDSTDATTHDTKNTNYNTALGSSNYPTDPTRTGYTFDGWYPNRDGSGAEFTNATVVTDNITVYAKWTRDTSKIVFDLNGGNISGSTTSITKTGNTSDTLASTDFPADPSRTDYRFNGWSGSYTSTNLPNFPAAKGGTLTITAQWVGQSTVTFNVNGGTWVGTGGAASQTGDVGTNITMPADPTRTGYDFVGWKKGTSAAVTSGITFPATAGTTDAYVAQWTVKQYTVSFLWNTTAHSHTLTEVYKTTKGNYGDAITAPSPAPSMTGYTFGGWYTDAACSTAMTSSDTYPANDTLKMYAKWTPNAHQITYYVNGPSGGSIASTDSPVSFNYGDSVAAKAGTIIGGTITGWNFVKWNTKADGSGTDYAATATLPTATTDADIDLYAQWTVDVTFDSNLPAGAGTSSTVTETPAKGKTLAASKYNAPTTLTDYNFVGWFDDPGATGGTQYSASSTYPAPKALYARWTAKPYTYTFNANGGSFPSGTTNTSTTGGVGTAIPAPSNNPTRTDYNFLGWGTSSASTSADATVATTMPSGGGTVYAVWEQKVYQYVFDANGGAWADSDTTKTTTGIHKGDSVAKWTTDPVRTDFAFKGWAATPTGTTALSWPQTMPSEPTGGKVTVYAIWVPVYDVTYVNGYAGNQHGTVDTTKNVVDHEQYTYTVESPSAAIPAGTGESWNSGSTYFTDASGKHWKFLYWEANDASKTKYYGGNTFTLKSDTVLTAVWEQTYKVTLGDAVSATDGTTKLSTANVSSTSASFNSTTLNTGSGGTKFVWVKAGDKVSIASVSLGGANTGNYVFAKWTATASTGAFGTAGDTAQATEFTPTADTTLAPSYWLKPSLSGTDYHHLNVAVDATLPLKDPRPTGKFPDGTTKNDLPKFEWTQNDATLASSDEFQIQIGSDWKTPVLGTDVVKSTSGGVVTYTFQRNYLNGLPVADGAQSATFKVRVNSNTPASGADTKLESELIVYVTPEKLEEVNIWAKGGTSKTDTANVESAKGRDQVQYHDHTPTAITASNKLTYTWYVGDSAPSQQAYSTNLAQQTQSVTNAKTAAAAKGTAITGSVDTLNNYVDITGVDAYKGKYIYAVVAASGTGYGAVVTNAIAVDYDAVIKVNKDGNPITDAVKNNYKVYLVPNGVTPAVSSGALTGTGVVEAKYTSGNQYKTDDSALTGGTTYKVYVNKVEGNFTTFVDTTLTVKTQTAATAAPEANFYSVNAVGTTVKDAYDNSATPKNVGETFQDSDKPTTVFTTAGASSSTITVTSGNGVFKGSTVTAKTSQGTFAQDYHVDWGVTTTEPTSGLTYNAESSKQDKAYAAGTGITVTTNITQKTWAGVQLDQNLYTVTGNIWANNATAGIVNTSPKLTSGDYVFTGTSTNGTRGQNVTFSAKVPKSGAATGKITEKYSITADPKTSPLSTILGYVEWQDNVTSVTETAINTALTNKRLDGTNQNTLKAHITADNAKAFTIVVAASTYILTIPEMSGVHAKATQNWSTQGTDPGVATSGSNFTTAAWAVNYAYTGAGTYTFKLVNEGNTYLDVALNVKRSNSADDGYVYGAKTSGTSGVATGKLTAGSGSDMKDGVGVTFAGLATSFASLAPGAEKTFTVTIPTGLAVNDAADYAFEFTSTEAGKSTVYGPSVTYKLTQSITPLKITKISSTESSGVYSATGLELNSSASIPAGVTEANEVEYKWYVSDIGVTPTLTKTGVGSLSTNATLAAGNQGDGTYKLAAADQGKRLWVVAHNKATGNVIEAAMAEVTDLPYDLDIIVKENDDKVAAANKGNYKVYLVPSTVTPDFTADLATQKIVEAKDKAGTDGAYTAEGLDPNVTYKIYTNAVGGTTNANLQDSKVTAALTNFTGGNSPVVTYRNVILSNTTVNNQQYGSAITTNDDPFYKTVDGTTVTSIGIATLDAPTAKVGTTDVATSNVDKWVQSGTTVTMTYPAWTKDYALTWTGATSTGTNTPAAGDTATKTVTAADTTIKTELKLNLYDFEVYVMGKGSVSQITLSGGTSGKYTSATAGSGFVTGTVNTTSGAVSASSSVGAGSSVTFRVPAGTYEVVAATASGTDLVGYREPHDATNAASTALSPLSLGVPTKKNMDVVVNTSGRAMSVADNADTKVTGASKGSDTASYKSSTDKSSPTINQAITLPYGYDAVELTLTVTNVSASETDTLYDVTMNKVNVDKDSTGKLSVTDPASASSIALDGSANLLMAADGTGDQTAVKLSIADGLAKGSYHSTLVFTFSTVDGTTNDDEKASVTYDLTINVEPAEFTAVTVTGQDASGNVALGQDLKPLQYETAKTNLFGVTGTNAIVEGTDYTYKWYATPADKTLTGSWSAGVFTPATAASATELTPKTGTYELEGDTIAAHPGEKIWLVVTAEDGKNVVKYAISDPVTTGFQPVVKISVDGADVATKPNDGDYVVTITDDSDSNKTWKTVWDVTAEGFVPVAGDGSTLVSLDASKSYIVKTNKYQGDADTTLVAHGTKLSNASASARTVTVPFFTVNAVETKDFAAISGLGETFAAMPEVEFAFGGNAIADKTPVLSGQNVTAKIKAAWSEDYKLTWHTATTTTAPDPDDNAYEATSTGAKTMTAKGTKQTATQATAANASGDVAVTGKTYIGGRLDQNTYIITGTVKGTTGDIIGVTVEKTDDPKKTYTWTGSSNSDAALIKPHDGNSNSSLNPNETIDFNVVKGTYAITASPNTSNTVISKTVWEPGQTAEDVVTGPSGVLTGKDVTASETKLTYNFEVHVEGSALSLSVTDKATADGDATNDVTVTAGLNDPKLGTKSVEHYFSYIDKKLADATADDVIAFPLKLENGGNMDMTVGLEVFHFASASAMPDYTDQTKWEGAGQVKAPEFTAAASATASVVVPTTSASSKTVMTLTDVMAKDTVVPAKASVGGTPDAVDALTITLGKDAWSKDSGLFVFRFTGNCDAGKVYMYYVLDLTIDQLPITAVTTQVNGAAATGMVGVDDKLQVEGYVDGATAGEGLDHVTVKTSAKPDTAMAATAKLTDDDVKFAWVKVAAGTTVAVGDFTVANDGTLSTTKTGYTINQGKEYTLATGDQDSDFYLVAYAPNYTGNVTNAKDKAISAVVKAKRTVGVKVSVDGVPLAPNGDPGYTIYLVEDGKNFDATNAATGADGTWATTWNNGSAKRYEAPIDTDKTYHVYAVTYQGGSTVIEAITGTLGGTNTEQTVPYYTVTFTENVAVDSKYDNFASYLPNGAAGSDNAIQKALSVTVSKTKSGTTAGGDKLPASATATATTVPVLKDMNVAVTVDATKSSNNATSGVKTSWSETDVQPLHTLAATGWTPSATAYAASITSNADIAVTSSKTFSAKLEQVLFDVTFTVVDNTPDETKSESGYVDPRITKAKLQPDPAKEGATSSFEVTVYGTAATPAGYISTGTDGDPGTAGATVTFKGVPKGGYEILVSETGNRTKVDGFTWNATGDALNDPIDPGKIVDTDTTDAVNKHAGNTIQIQYSSYAVQWKDNFNTADGTTLPDPNVEDGPEFVNSTGFQKVDTAKTGPFLALKEGYSADTNAVLTYKVQVENTGAMAMAAFWINQTNQTNLIADLTQVTIIRKEDGTSETADVSAPGNVTLNVGDIVEFTVTIPSGADEKDPNKNPYTSAFQVRSISSGNISKSTYTPAYQVKPNVEFDPGSAVVLYGDNKFRDTPVDIAPSASWDTTAYKPDFAYSVLTEEELTDYLDGAARPDNAYTKDGKTGGESKLPDWLVLNANTGAVTFKSDLYATEVNVQVKGTPKDFDAYDLDANGHKVNNEIVFYIKAVDQDTNEVYYTTYTVDVEPGQLAIVGGGFTYTTDEAVGGLSVDRSKFTYTKVTNQATAPLDVIPAAVAPDVNTGAGNDPSQDTPTNGKVFVDTVHTATWTVAPEKYESEVEKDYVFKVTYKPDTPAEKWNYKPATYTETIEARKPDMSLKFADAIDNATKVVKGDTYTTQDGTDMTGLNSDVPVKLDYIENAKRLGESITYLDDVPTYTVKIQKIGAIYGMKLEQGETVGFQVVDAQGKPTALPTFGKTDTDENEDLILTVKLSEISAGLWAGEHKISFTATGYSTSDTTGEADVVATYELSLNVRKKVIPEAHVSELTEPVKFDTPDTDVTVTIQDPTDPDTMVKLDELDEDKYGNKPIDTVKVEHDPGDDPYQPNTDYKTVVTLEANPNYTFEDDKAPEEANYTAGDEPGEDETYPDGGYTVELTPDDPSKPEAGKNTKVTFTKETKTAEAVLKLEFNDTNPADEADALGTYDWAESYENTRVVRYYLDQVPDFYDIYLQNPGTEDLYNVGLKVTANTGTRNDGQPGDNSIGLFSADASTQFVSSPSSTAFTSLAEIDATGADSQTKSFKADLRNLKFAGTYTLKVRAEGTTTKPAGQASLLAAGNTAAADYTLIVKIVPRPIVVANVTGLGAAEVDQKVSDNVSKIEVKGQVLYRGDDSIDGANKTNVSDKSDVDLINKGEDTEWGPENGLDVNGLKRLDYQIKWYEVDENGNTTEMNADPEEGDTFKPGTAYRVVLKLIPDPNYIFVRVSTEEHQYDTAEEDFFYFNPKDNGKDASDVGEDNQRIDEEQVEYNMTVTTGTGDKKVVPLYPAEDEESTAPNRPIIIEKKQQGEIAQLRFDDVKVGADTDTTGPAVHDKRTVSVTKGTKPGVYHINLGAYIDHVDQVSVVEESVTGKLAEIVTKVDPETGETSYVNNWTLKKLNEPHNTLLKVDENGNPVNKNIWELDLSGLDTSSTGTGVFVLTLKAEGIRTLDEAGLETELIRADYTLTLNITNPAGGGGGGSAECPNQVTYLLGVQGTTNDAVMELVATRGKVKNVPNITAIDGYKFLGWSLAGPTGNAETDAKRELVDPKNVPIQGDTTFYAVYQPLYQHGKPYHEHYVIGYPNGNFGPADNINRASVATIIARAVLPNFVEGADYGNPGAYSDVNGHWAASAIAYCSRYGVFNGYEDGTFRPDQSITRQELALVMARLSGVKTAQEMPFADMGDAGAWAVDGIYTAYANGWVNGYTDGTFKPLNPIRRDETVKIFNAYLYRGVNEEGLGELVEYVHSGVASNNTENGATEYMTWPDVTKDQWAYYEIIEAANDHEYVQDASLVKGYTVPETWAKSWIDEKWRYHDDLNDGGPALGLLSAGFRVWSR